MEFKINEGELLREIKFNKSSDGESVILTFYNSMSGKNAKLFIERDQLDEVVDILNKFKKWC
jgi:hypothetical protein